MRTRFVAILMMGALAACGGESTVSEPARDEPAAGAAAEADIAVTGPERRILAFGDSLFAGYGLSPGESYPARLEAALRARGIAATVANAGVSGDTTAAGLARFSYVLDSQQEPPDLVILELGGNDLLRGIPPSETRANLSAMLDELRERDIPVLLMGMRAPPNLGAAYQAEFDAIYPQLATRYGADLVPFFLAPVFARPDLMQPDRIHPTAQGIEAIVTDTVDEVTQALPPQDTSR